MRWTRLSVLPVPAAASTRSVVPRSWRSRRARPGRAAGGAASVSTHGSPGMPRSTGSCEAAIFACMRGARLSRRRRRTRSRRTCSLPCRAACGKTPARSRSSSATRDLARPRRIERDRQPLALSLSAREEVARARDFRHRSRRGPAAARAPWRRARAGSGGRRGCRVRPCTVGAARLVVPDVEGAVGRLVDAVDRAAQQERVSRPERRSRRGRGLAIEARAIGARQPEGDLEVARRPRPCSAPPRGEERAAGDAGCPGAARSKASSLAGGIFSRQAAICGRRSRRSRPAWRAASGFSPAAVIRSKKSAEDLVQQGARLHRHRATRGVALDFLGRLDAQDVLQEVAERTLRERLHTRGRLGLAGRARIELGRARRGPSRPRS